MPAVPAVLLSQLLIFLSWQDAKAGAIANIIIAVVVLIGFCQWRFTGRAQQEIKALLSSITPSQEIIDQSRIQSLPPVVQKWLQRSGIVGRQKIRQVHLRQIGNMRTAADGKWMKVTAEQWFNTERPGFIWLADVQAGFGLFLAGRDMFADGQGSMLIKLLALFTIVDARSREIDQGAMVRYLAETIWFPSAALEKYMQWTQIDSSTAQAVMNYNGLTVTGYLKFNEQGDVVSFSAQRYYDRKTGATLEEWLVTMDPQGYREYNGIRIPCKSSVTWKLKEGDYTWFHLEITEVTHNLN